MGIKIRAAVGKNARNNYDDVEAVQRLLKKALALSLVLDGLCGPKTIAAIEQFQKKSFGWADARVDPQGQTLAALNQGPTNSSPASSKSKSPAAARPSCDIPREGPQSFAPAVPGTTAVDACLLAKNKEVAENLMAAASRFRNDQDFRWFFTYAHGRISQQINLYITRFQRPNALIRLNMHFGTQYLRAASGQPHEQWKNAFAACKAVQIAGQVTSVLSPASGLPLEVEACGAIMANIHISIDLAQALNEVGCIPPDDYANVYPFVLKGAEDALIQLRGEFGGTIEAKIKNALPEWMQLEKLWRNAVYQQVCNTTPRDPTPDFMKETK